MKPRALMTKRLALELLQPENLAKIPQAVGRLRMTPGAAKVLLDNIEVVRQAQGHSAAGDLHPRALACTANQLFLLKLHNLSVDLRWAEANTPSIASAIRKRTAEHIFSSAEQGASITLDDLSAHRALTVFGFSGRDLDRLFEQEDADDVVAHLLQVATTSPSVLAVCADVMRWPDAIALRDRQEAHRQRG